MRKRNIQFSGSPVIILLALMLGSVLMLCGFRFLEKANDPYEARILPNVIAGDTNLGGMSRKEAKKVLTQMGKDYASADMLLKLPGFTGVITPEDSGVHLDVQKALDAAYGYGRQTPASGQPCYLDMTEFLQFREESLNARLDALALECRDGFQAAGYEVIGQMPDLTREDLDETTPLPVIKFYTGRSAPVLDTQTAMEKLLWAYGCHRFEAEVPSSGQSEAPTPLDIKAIAAQVNIAPVNFDVDRKTLDIIPGAFGCAFHVTTARREVLKAGPDAEVTIPMTLVSPEVGREDAYFQDVLGYCETPHSTNASRNNNLKMACSRINGLVLKPGQTLSYNELLGQRTEAAGYLPAPAYSGTNLVNTPGGGICQVSSTLYLASMYAELTALERISHGFKPTYMEAGTDATVSWPNPDLKLQNPHDFPIRIRAEVTDDKVMVWIYGCETRDYTVKITTSAQSSSPTYIASYLVKLDKNGNQISKDFLAYSSYMD